MSTLVMVPVKDLSRAKSRLAPLLSLEERRGLAMRLLRGVLEAVSGLPAGIRKAVVSSYAPALALARELGLETLPEPDQVSESHSVDRASRHYEAQGVSAVLRVPLDLPLLGREALQAVLTASAEPVQAVLVPSRDGMGTNGLYRCPPTLFPSRFGPGSLGLHRGHLRALDVPHRVLSVPAMALDLDDPADVAELVRQDVSCDAATYLKKLGVPERLAAMARAGA